jgi:hypothetical protein
MHRNLNLANEKRLEQELQTALLGTVLQLDRAARRYALRRRRYGNDYGCRRLLDELRISRSLVWALVDEVRAQRNGRTAHA